MHAFTGCDTTSAFYGKGKNKLLNAIESEKLIEIGAVFNKPNANREDLAANAYKLICAMYSTKAEKQIFAKSNALSLNDLRYLHYSKGKKRKIFNFETLPPTEGSAKQHAYRTYYQVQMWVGNDQLKPTDWGWEVRNNCLLPIGTKDPPMPKELLQQISCSCKGNCTTQSCGCKKHGLRCTDLCVNCLRTENVVNCENFDDKAPTIDEEEEDSEITASAADIMLDQFPDIEFNINQRNNSDFEDTDQFPDVSFHLNPQVQIENDADDSD